MRIQQLGDFLLLVVWFWIAGLASAVEPMPNSVPMFVSEAPAATAPELRPSAVIRHRAMHINYQINLAPEELDRVELINLRRMPLVSRYSVINQGEPIYVGHPETLAIFIEETIVRYSSYYPLLEALYWTIETKPLAEDLLEV